MTGGTPTSGNHDLFMGRWQKKLWRYPLVNGYIANWKITIFKRSITCKWTVFHSYVSLPESNRLSDIMTTNIRKMEEILHHLGWLKPYKWWDKLDKPSTGAGILPSTLFFWLSNIDNISWVGIVTIVQLTRNSWQTLPRNDGGWGFISVWCSSSIVHPFPVAFNTYQKPWYHGWVG